MGNDQKKINKLISKGLIDTSPGKVINISVQHDDWCRRLKDKGDCNCNPTIVCNGVVVNDPEEN